MNNRLRYLIYALVLPFIAIGQANETIVNRLSVTGVHVGLISEYSQINGEVGLDIGWSIGLQTQSAFIGYYGTESDFGRHEISISELADEYEVGFRQRGLWVGIAPNSRNRVHFYGQARFGWGRIKLEPENLDDSLTDKINAITADIGIEVNVFSWFKLAVTGGYRLVNGVTRLPGLNNRDFNSPVGTLTCRFGWNR